MTYASAGVSLALVLVLTAGGGVLHGRLSNRWGPPAAMVTAGARLSQLPTHFASWDEQSSQHLPESTRLMLECTGDSVRCYVNSATKSMVEATLLVGPAGPLAVHTPEICFSSRDYQAVGKRRRVTIIDSEGVEHKLWKIDFRRRDVDSSLVHVYYAWSVGGPWMAPDKPRYQLAGWPYLYKIQLIGYPTNNVSLRPIDPVPAFLQEFSTVAARQIMHSSLEGQPAIGGR